MELFTDKTKLKDKCNGKVFYYMVLYSSTQRGYNRTVKVYVINKKTKRIFCIGESHHNSASWKGSISHARSIIASIYNYKFDGYDFIRKDILVDIINF